MRKGIDEPLEQIVEPPVDVPKRLMEAQEEERSAREAYETLKNNERESNKIPEVLAYERHRHAEIVLDYWQRQAGLEQRAFEAAVDNYAFLVVAGLALHELKRGRQS